MGLELVAADAHAELRVGESFGRRRPANCDVQSELIVERDLDVARVVLDCHTDVPAPGNDSLEKQ